jgi:hypothetical protein
VSDLIDAIEGGVSAMVGEINTSMPGVVVSYDAGRNRAVVRPALPRMLADGEALEAPTIAEVPVLWPTAGGAVFTMPLKEGDQVWLDFSQRSLEGWLQGNDAAPDDPRQFDLSDCVARPGAGRDVQNVATDAVVLSLGGATIRLEEGGTMRLIGNVAIQGGTLTHNGVNVGSTHTHTNVQAGGSLSGPPAP